jgi:hypothetical protein
VFERKKLVVSTLEYASLRDGLQQQGLIVESACKARDIAEGQLADAQARMRGKPSFNAAAVPVATLRTRMKGIVWSYPQNTELQEPKI